MILSSAIAETSLTVPGVNVVIDSGLSRVNRMDINTGMEKLTTEKESEFSAEQRKGRAGRLCEGRNLYKALGKTRPACKRFSSGDFTSRSCAACSGMQ